MKLMYTAWGDDLPTALRDPALHQRLAAAHVRRLQLNLDDADVAPAMRIATGAEHIGAVVSVWADSDEPVTRELEAITERLAGWEVDERLPIPPPETTDGERMDALANIAILQRPDDLDRDEWLHRWLVDHTPIAMATQATFGYVQNIVTRPVTASTPRRVDALVEGALPERRDDRHARVLRQRRRRPGAPRPARPADDQCRADRIRPRHRPGAGQPLRLRPHIALHQLRDRQ